MASQSVINMQPAFKGLSFDRPAANQIFGFVRDAIINMELLPGQMISETALAQKFGVSRTPVREAIIKLCNIGFVEVLPQRGTYVSKFSEEKTLESRFIREALEISIVNQLAAHTDTALRMAVVEASEKIIKEQKKSAADNDAIAFQNLDDDFHQALANFTDYPRVALLIKSEKAHMDRVRNLSLHIAGQYKRIIMQHTAISHAIKIGSVEKSTTAMSIHMKDVSTILKLVSQDNPEYFY